MREVECQDCGWEGPEEEMDNEWPAIPHIKDRISPGEIVPAGECPLCGALCHLKEGQHEA